MPHLSPGDTITTRVLTTIRAETVRVPDPQRLVHLQFRRYAGCPVCNLHLRAVARRHDDVVAAGIHAVAIFHSPAEDMRPHQGDLQFAAVADPDRRLYHEFGVEATGRRAVRPTRQRPLVRGRID
jgi:peroxiredoxin